MGDGCTADGKPSPNETENSSPTKEGEVGNGRKDETEIQDPTSSKEYYFGLSRKIKVLTVMLIITILRTESTRDLALLLISDVRNLALSTWCVFQLWFSKQHTLAGGPHHDEILRTSAMPSLIAEDTCKLDNQTVFETEFVQSKGWCADHETGIQVPDIFMIVYLANDALMQGLMDMGSKCFSVFESYHDETVMRTFCFYRRIDI